MYGRIYKCTVIESNGRSVYNYIVQKSFMMEEIQFKKTAKEMCYT